MSENWDELMSLRMENTKHKLILRDIVRDLETQAKSKEPIILSMKYVDWIKDNVDLRFNGEKKDKPLINKKREISIQLEDDFGRVQTRIKTRYNPSELMDKIVGEYEEKGE